MADHFDGLADDGVGRGEGADGEAMARVITAGRVGGQRNLDL